MKLQFLGAAQTVTGSRYLLSSGQEQILVDCGLFQGHKELRLKNWEAFPVDPTTLKAIILTHAHLDHSGYIPLLIKNGFQGPIYSTAATKDLSRILLMDAGFLQEEEARFANKRGYSKHHPALPLYTRADAEVSIDKFVTVPWHHKIKINDIEISFFRAGHLLGAASVRINGFGKSILFSGDLGRPNDPLLKSPEDPPNADYLVVESTYGDRKHQPSDAMQDLQDIILRTYNRRGIVLIPSFAVGRAQTILYFLKELKSQGRIPDIPIFLNSPMANSANKVFCQYAGEHKLSVEQAREVCAVAKVVSSVEESVALNEDRSPKIIIASSGMATGGRVLHHLKTIAPHRENTIVFVGFQAGGTRGDAMVRGALEVKIHGEMWPIAAEVCNLQSLSAHADADEILSWVRHMSVAPTRAFVSHGEFTAASSLGRRLQEELRVLADVPGPMTIVDL